MLTGVANVYPPVEKKLSVGLDIPIFTVNWAYMKGRTEQQQAVGDLIIIAFYYLLRISEYTVRTKYKKKTWT